MEYVIKGCYTRYGAVAGQDVGGKPEISFWLFRVYMNYKVYLFKKKKKRIFIQRARVTSL